MTVRRWLVALLVGAALLVAGAAFLILTQPPAVHADGAGPLGSLGGPGHESMSVDPQGSETRSWTYGLRLCIVQGDRPATLRRVAPLATLGSGFREVGMGLRTFTPTPDHEPIISVDGYPPPTPEVPDALAPVDGYPPPTSEVPDALAPVDGYLVETPCSNGPRDSYTELLIGLAKDGDDGGGWKGIRVTYEVDGRTRTVTLDHDLLICGRSNPVC